MKYYDSHSHVQTQLFSGLRAHDTNMLPIIINAPLIMNITPIFFCFVCLCVCVCIYSMFDLIVFFLNGRNQLLFLVWLFGIF